MKGIVTAMGSNMGPRPRDSPARDEGRAQPIGRLSKGYRQRVGLAQALLHDPEVLVLDEPTAGLDPKQIIETRELIKGLGGDHTVILSTHILPEVSVTCGRVVIINQGRVVAEDSPESLTQQLQGKGSLRVEVRGETRPVLDALRSVAGVADVVPGADLPEGVTFEVETEAGRDVRPDVARVVVEGGFQLLGLRQVGMSLEDIFLHLTTTEPGEEPTPVPDGETLPSQSDETEVTQ